jgi:hypothetical protein
MLIASRNMLCSFSVHDSRLLVIVYGLRALLASGFIVEASEILPPGAVSVARGEKPVRRERPENVRRARARRRPRGVAPRERSLDDAR